MTTNSRFFYSRYLIMALFALSVVIGFQSKAFAQDEDLNGKYGKKLAKELNLTAQQAEQFQAIRKKYQPRIAENRQAADKAKEDLTKSLQDPKKGPEYQQVLRDKFKKVQDLKRESHLARFEMTLEIRELLTNDQITKFKGLHPDKDKHVGRRKRHMKNNDEE